MKIIACPLNGPRNINEFTCFGPVHWVADEQALSDAEWCRYLFYLDNRAGVIREWWRHNSSNYFFIAERNTVTDEILRTFGADKLSLDGAHA